MVEQGPLQFPLGRIGPEGEEVETVRVFDDLRGQIRLRGRQRGREVRDGLALPRVEVRLDPVHQHRPRPAVLNGLAGVPETFDGISYLRKQLYIVTPGDFCHRLWRISPLQFSNSLLEILARELSRRLRDNSVLPSPSQIERTHVPDVLGRKASRSGELTMQVGGQTLNDPPAPTLSPLAFDDISPDAPVELDQLAIDR
jgi:hypothetical protein